MRLKILNKFKTFLQNGDLGLGIDPSCLESELNPEKLTEWRDHQSPTLNHEHQT